MNAAGVVHVERLLVVAELQTVGTPDVVCHSDRRAAGWDEVHRRRYTHRCIALRIREVHAAFCGRDDVVRPAEGFPLPVVGDDSLFSFRPYDARSEEAGSRLNRSELTLCV